MRILGLDFGARRIGVAVSDPTGSTAQPLTVIEKSQKDTDVQKIKQLIDEYDVEKVVIGLPVSLAGELGPQAKAVLEYVEKLRATVKVPVTTWDERLTTASAKRMLLETEVRRSRRKEVIDKIAAAIMLQSYLDAKRSGE